MILLALLATLSPTAELDAVGDIMLARWVERRIVREGADAPFRAIGAELRRADVSVGNLECVLGSAPFALGKQIRLRAATISALGLRRGGFGLVSVANNHAMDCGPRGLQGTERALRKLHVAWTGTSLFATVVTRKGIRIAFLGICEFRTSSAGGQGIIYSDDPRVFSAIRQTRAKADIVVAMVHWGQEGTRDVTPFQIQFGQKLADAGADLILGSHPHVLQPTVWLHGLAGRRCLVAYSLGNFVFDARLGAESRSEILQVTLGKDGVRGYREKPVSIERGFPTLPAHNPTDHLERRVL